MKRKTVLVSIAVVAGVFVVLTLVLTPRHPFALVWKDDFNYQSTEELQNAGWTIGLGHGGPFVGNGVVSLYEQTSINYSDFPEQLFEFSVETGLIHAGIITLTTRRHFYSLRSVYAGGQGPIAGRYIFEVDGQTEFQIDVPGWNQSELHALTIEQKNRVLSVYAGNAHMNSYTAPDIASDALWSVTLGGGGGVYDYVLLRAPI